MSIDIVASRISILASNRSHRCIANSANQIMAPVSIVPVPEIWSQLCEHLSTAKDFGQNIRLDFRRLFNLALFEKIMISIRAAPLLPSSAFQSRGCRQRTRLETLERYLLSREAHSASGGHSAEGQEERDYGTVMAGIGAATDGNAALVLAHNFIDDP